MLKALFLDRDGTLIVHKPYLSDPAGVALIPGTAASLRRARELGYGLFLFTNQSGIGRGMYSADDAERVNARMEELLGLPPPAFDGICVAPESPAQPVRYRKPSPRFILESIALHGLDPGQCWMVGDSASDVRTGLAAGIHSAIVLSGPNDPRGLPEFAGRPIPAYASFAEFVASLG